MLLISFCGKFYSFYKLFMQKFLSRSKHEEFESNSALQIRDQKERSAEITRKLEHHRNFAGLRKFRKLAEFRSILRNFASHCSPSCTIHLSCCFTLLPFCYNFLFLPILSLVIAFNFGSFCNFAWLGQYISSCTVIKENFCSVIKLARSFQLSRFFSFSSTFSHFLSLSWLPNTLQG